MYRYLRTEAQEEVETEDGRELEEDQMAQMDSEEEEAVTIRVICPREMAVQVVS
jgi:hypothetical protein